jgi:nitrogen regulatory protein P-II 1
MLAIVDEAWNPKPMKKIEAVFVSRKFDHVRSAMTALNLTHYVVGELSAHEPEQAGNHLRWSSLWHEDFAPRLKLEVVVDDGIAREVARTILHAVRGRCASDASVTMSTVETVVEIEDARATRQSLSRQIPSLHAGGSG